MDGDRIARALARIEAAASRIEAAGYTGAGGDPLMEARYIALRKEADFALSEVDRLIEALEK